jgi:histidyl-tRNA synthetase
MTPTLARMIAAHERSYKKPVKWFAIPQLFRYERQQKGRLREHFQFNADIIGETDPAADAELIALLIDTLRAFGLTEEDFVVRLSSRNAWREFFARHRAIRPGNTISTRPLTNSNGTPPRKASESWRPPACTSIRSKPLSSGPSQRRN